MSNKQFKAESKRLLDLMINSIYTNKEIFLRELISNASDAMDKLYYRSLTDKNLKINKEDLKIKIDIDKEKRTLTITDNGCGMTEDELDKNLGTIAKSGSLAFKEQNDKKEDINIIGQFGVGFYSAFMVSDEVKVESKSIDNEQAYCWTSKGVEGYTIEPCDKKDVGTKITLHIKEDSEEEKYSEFLEEYKIQWIIKRYSDYISYPIQMDVEHEKTKEGSKETEKVIETETINSMIPLWKKDKKEIKEEEYNEFYTEKFNDFQAPLKVIHSSVEGQYKYDALLYIPSHLPYDYYTKEYEKGLQLYANGVLIMDKCSDLLPDYFGFVKGLVDSDDLSLNISREVLQHDRQLRVIEKNIENKIKSELENMLKSDRTKYEEFFKVFGVQLKYGTYSDYGMNKDKLQDLLLFYSSTEKKLVTLKEYVMRMKEDQKAIYYASGESIDKIDLLPQVEILKDKGYEILYLTDNVDEFVFQVLNKYEENQDKKELNVNDVENFEEVSGKGLKYTYNNKNIKIGNSSFTGAKTENIVGTVLYLNIDEQVVGSIVLSDEIKPKTKETIERLHKLGIKTKMFTGDKKEIAEKIAKQVGIQAVKAEMLPQDKYNELDKIIEQREENKKVAFVGDGINDSPVLARADIGISMGGIGSSSAIEASDVVIMTDELNKIVDGIEISKKTNKIIIQNLIFAIGVKILTLLLSLFGIADMWQAVFADVGTTLITIFNTLRILK